MKTHQTTQHHPKIPQHNYLHPKPHSLHYILDHNHSIDFYPKCQNHENPLHPDVKVEESAVAFSDTVTDVRAVVVEGRHASFTAAAVLCAEGLLDVADGAVFVFDVQLDFIVCLEDILLMVVNAGF